MFHRRSGYLPPAPRRPWVLFFIFSAALPALLSQALSPEKQVLLIRKGEVLQEIQRLEHQKADTQSTLAQAESLRDMAKSANQVNQANIYAQAVGVAQQAITIADKKLAADHDRLNAINRALSWHDSAAPRAVATIVRGHISLVGQFGEVPFDPTAPVEIGQHISVGDDGFLELQLQDGSQMQLGPKSDFEYERDVEGVYYQLFRGKLHKIRTAVMGVRGANDEPRYRGARCIAAVRGTEFTLEVSNGEDVLTVFEGEIEVDPGAGRAKIVLKAGQHLTVPKSGGVSQPIAFDSTTISRWWEH